MQHWHTQSASLSGQSSRQPQVFQRNKLPVSNVEVNLITEYKHQSQKNTETSYTLYIPETLKHIIFCTWVCVDKYHPRGCAEVYELILGRDAGYWDTSVHTPCLLLPSLSPAAQRSESANSPQLHTIKLHTVHVIWWEDHTALTFKAG
jgi:hypothetical protein